jgi:hypothetical protein
LAAVDIATFIADLKDHSADHGFHVHDERHFVETYSMRQAWEIDLHPAEACGGPLDMLIALEIDPRVMLAFEDAVLAIDEMDEPSTELTLPLTLTWALPPLPHSPDLLILATDLAGIGGTELPLQLSAADAFTDITDPPLRSLTIGARREVSLDRLYLGEEMLSDTLALAAEVSHFLLDRAPAWLGDS